MWWWASWSWWFRRCRGRSEGKLFRCRFQARCRNYGRCHGCLPRRLSASIGLSEGFHPGIIGAVLFAAAIARRLSIVIVTKLGEPVTHLGPAVIPRHAGIELPVLNLHVSLPLSKG